MRYSVNVKKWKNYDIGEEYVRRLVVRSLKKLKIKKPVEVSVLLTDSQTVRSLNNKYRRKDEVASVLSFVFSEEKGFVVPRKQNIILGEIVISSAKAKKMAKKEKVSLKKKISSLVIHGLLHLLGYSHQNKKKRKVMEAKEEQLIKKLAI